MVSNYEAKIDKEVSNDAQSGRDTAALKDQLFGAVNEDNVEQLKKILPADLEVKDKYGSTLLHCAAGKGSKKCLQHLLEVDNEGISKTDKRGCQPLHNAAYNGQAETVELLLTNHASIFAENKEGQTPLLAACLAGHMETVKLFLRTHHEEKPSELPPTDKAKNTVLHMSVIGNHSMVKELLQFMMSLGYTTEQRQELVDSVNVAGQTILHIAAIRCQLPAVQQCLTELELSVDNINSMKDEQQKTCEDYAQKCQKSSVMEDQNDHALPKQPSYAHKSPGTLSLDASPPINPRRNMSIESTLSALSTFSNVTPSTDGVNVLGEPVKQFIVKKKILHKDHKVEVRVMTPSELPKDDQSLAFNRATDMNIKLELHCGLHGSILDRLPSDCHLVSPIVMVKLKTSKPLMMRVNIPHALTSSKALNNEVQLFAISTLGVPGILETNLYTLDDKTCTITMVINRQQIFVLTVMGTLLTQSQSFPRISRPLAIRCTYYVLVLSDPGSLEIHVKVYCAIELPITWKLLSDIKKQPNEFGTFTLSHERVEISYQVKKGTGWSVLSASQTMNALSILPSPQAERLLYPPVCVFKVLPRPDAKRVSEKVACELCIAAGKTKLVTQRFYHDRPPSNYCSKQSTPVSTGPLLNGRDEGHVEQFELVAPVQSTTANVDTMENNGQVNITLELSNGKPLEKDKSLKLDDSKVEEDSK